MLFRSRGRRGSAANDHLAELMAKLTDLGRQLGEGLSAPDAAHVGNLIWNTLRGIVVAQMTWPEPVDQSRDLQTLVDVVSTYIGLRR